jgi:hypothetical protein
MKASFSAGFILERDGIRYQEEIKAYRDTAHLRDSAELKGDILYTFVKRTRPELVPPPTRASTWLSNFVRTSDAKSKPAVTIAVDFHVAIVQNAAMSLQSGQDKSQTMEWLNLLILVGKGNRERVSLIRLLERIASDQP